MSNRPSVPAWSHGKHTSLLFWDKESKSEGGEGAGGEKEIKLGVAATERRPIKASESKLRNVSAFSTFLITLTEYIQVCFDEREHYMLISRGLQRDGGGGPPLSGSPTCGVWWEGGGVFLRLQFRRCEGLPHVPAFTPRPVSDKSGCMAASPGGLHKGCSVSHVHTQTLPPSHRR